MTLLRFRVVIFLAIVAVVYAFVVFRIHTLSDAQPNQSNIASQTTVPQPHIDQATVDKINQLQNNSVSVQALFNQARQNPFQE